jgi:hypothetical protein
MDIDSYINDLLDPVKKIYREINLDDIFEFHFKDRLEENGISCTRSLSTPQSKWKIYIYGTLYVVFSHVL